MKSYSSYVSEVAYMRQRMLAAKLAKTPKKKDKKDVIIKTAKMIKAKNPKQYK